MFNSVSMSAVGAIITLFELAVKITGVELPEGTIAGLVNGLVTAFGAIWLIWGTVRRKDLSMGLFRKFQ